MISPRVGTRTVAHVENPMVPALERRNRASFATAERHISFDHRACVDEIRVTSA